MQHPAATAVFLAVLASARATLIQNPVDAEKAWATPSGHAFANAMFKHVNDAKMSASANSAVRGAKRVQMSVVHAKTKPSKLDEASLHELAPATSDDAAPLAALRRWQGLDQDCPAQDFSDVCKTSHLSLNAETLKYCKESLAVAQYQCCDECVEDFKIHERLKMAGAAESRLHCLSGCPKRVTDHFSVSDFNTKVDMLKMEDGTLLHEKIRKPVVPTLHDHAVAAQKSAKEADISLKAAQKAFEQTKANVKSIEKTGKKIEGVAGDINELYKPAEPKKAQPKNVESHAAVLRSSAILLAAVLGVACS